MTQEQKDLLIKDLCVRIPYGVKVNHVAEMGIAPETLIGIAKDMITLQNSAGYCTDDIDLYKPYLFPLSSMTDEQKQEYTYIVNYISSDDTENWKEGEFIYVEQFTQLMRFYLVNHFDYMGLIPMGLAIDATGLNIY